MWLEIRLFSGLPSTQGSACDAVTWLPALKNKREMGEAAAHIWREETCASKA